ncbi:MAG: hypothetical protein IKP65_04805 [Alphaproteobacteria bacterium]|nr:hypothetical protein [Alphaproteobacteria bacterium]
MLKGIHQLTYGHKNFVVEKFSGWEQVEFEVNKINPYTYRITYYMNIYFSGHTLTLKHSDPLIVDKKQSWFSTEYTPEYEFHDKAFIKGLYKTFEESGYKSGESTDIIPDIVRWYAENTHTTHALEELKKDIKFCFEVIDEQYPKQENKE